MKSIRNLLIKTFFLTSILIQGCNSDSAEKFNGEWTEIVEGKTLPDKLSISCEARTCEWRIASGYDAMWNGGDYDEPEIKHLIMTDGKLDLGTGRTASIQDGKLYFSGKIFIRKQT